MAELLKDSVGGEFISALGEALCVESKAFDRTSFMSELLTGNWDSLELKERISAVTHALNRHLNGEYVDKIDVLSRISSLIPGLGGLVFPTFAEFFGAAHPQESLEYLAHVTAFSSSEFAIRPFIRADQDGVMARLECWAKNENVHIRRLASEGCRPRLPWGSQLKRFRKDPRPVLRVLEILKSDPEKYVQKSVANNLNDISKDNPEIALEVAEQWWGVSTSTDWIVRHGLRTLLKQGDSRALRLLGYGRMPELSSVTIALEPQAASIGGNLKFKFNFNNASAMPLRIEYAVLFLKQSGVVGRKVFQVAAKEFGVGKHSLARTHSFRQMTTRKHVPGPHRVELVINGKIVASREFQLKKARKNSMV